MSKTILADVDGFTPVIDSMIQEVGVMAAVVFGRIWRYCQMKDGACAASIETIAEELSLDRTTIMRHISTLEINGYLCDHTPDLRNRPHTYSDTGKAGLRVSITVAKSNTTITKPDTGVANCDSTVANCNTASCRNLRQEDSIKKEVKKEKECVAKNATQPAKKGDFLDCMIAHQKPSGKEDCFYFPEDLRPLAQAVCDLWHLVPPKNSKLVQSNFAFWIKGLRSLQEACGEFGPQAVQAAYHTWLKSQFTVGHPGALVITCRAEAGKLRGVSRPANQDDPLGGHTPEFARKFQEALHNARQQP